MDNMNANESGALSKIYYKELAGCLEFWFKYGVDTEYGGLLSCLDREGVPYGYDKAVWIQGRSVYTFSKFYNEFDKSDKWLDAAKNSYDFLLKNCFDADGRMYFIVTRDGKPVQKRRYFFSETFAVVAGAEYYKATGEPRALENARDVFDRILYLYDHPETLPPKYNPEVVQTKSLAVPMILTTTAQTLREADAENADKYSARIDMFIKEIITDFLKPDKKALLETVGRDGGYLDSPAGRTVNPGHAIEAAWFLMKEGMILSDDSLVRQAIEIMEWSFDIGWDKEYGGLLSFVDIDGRPSDKLEWDMKLWWPQVEALIAYLMAYKYTGEAAYFDKFRLIHDYSFEHFRDEEFGEWYGYLHRDGTVSNTLKGNIFKGPFHIPRALMICHSILNSL